VRTLCTIGLFAVAVEDISNAAGLKVVTVVPSHEKVGFSNHSTVQHHSDVRLALCRCGCENLRTMIQFALTAEGITEVEACAAFYAFSDENLDQTEKSHTVTEQMAFTVASR